jgi:hypothetical protein
MNNKGRQLSLFTDKQVRRSFIHRFTCNPKKDLIARLRLENLFGIRAVLMEDTQSISAISCNRHFVNKHKPYVKEGRKFYYD